MSLLFLLVLSLRDLVPIPKTDPRIGSACRSVDRLILLFVGIDQCHLSATNNFLLLSLSENLRITYDTRPLNERWNFFSVEGERFRTGGVMSYIGIGKCLFARFKMLPATYVLTRVYYVSSTVAMIRSGHFFPLGFSPSRRRAVSVDDLIFYLVTRSA
jgi:hypothetical protein